MPESQIPREWGVRRSPVDDTRLVSLIPSSEGVAVYPVPLEPDHVPVTHVVLAVDAVSSSSADAGRLDRLKSEVESSTDAALGTAGLAIQRATAARETGDGLLLAYPERDAALVTNAVFHLDHIVRWNNRYRRHPLRLRVAIHCGPLVLIERYHRPYIQATRLLTATEFIHAVKYCVNTDPAGDKLGAAMIFSPWIWDYIVAPFRAPLVPPGRCASISVDCAAYTGNAWIHLPGLDAETVLTNIRTRPSTTASPLRPVAVPAPGLAATAPVRGEHE